MNIIYSDRELAVIIKPVGMDSEHQVPAAIMEKLGGEVFPIHRLDLNVGGVMVYARTKAAAAQLSKLVQEGLLVKEYRALVHGTPPEGGVLEDFLFKDSRKNKVFVVKKERKGVKKASLESGNCRLCRAGAVRRLRPEYTQNGHLLPGCYII